MEQKLILQCGIFAAVLQLHHNYCVCRGKRYYTSYVELKLESGDTL